MRKGYCGTPLSRHTVTIALLRFAFALGGHLLLPLLTCFTASACLCGSHLAATPLRGAVSRKCRERRNLLKPLVARWVDP